MRLFPWDDEILQGMLGKSKIDSYCVNAYCVIFGNDLEMTGL